MAHKRLYRSNSNKIFAGIIGGVGEYFDVDPTIIRLLWILVVIFTEVVPRLIAYFIALFVVPIKKK